MSRSVPLVAAFFLALVAGCGGGGGGGGDDLPLFRVVFSDPRNGDGFVPVTKLVLVTFSRSVDPSTVHEDSLTIEAVGAVNQPQGETKIDAASGLTRLFWETTTGFQGSLLHVCRIDPGLRSTVGDPLGGSLSFQFTTAPAPPPPVGSLVQTATRLNTGRRSHTATLLLDGRVLLCGGFSQGTTITDRAETFTADTSLFDYVADPQTVGRANHTATRLADGRVLLCGGWIEDPTSAFDIDSTARAEVFDPTTNEFTEVGAMTHERVDHAALLLPDGRVLVTGGSELDVDSGFLTDFDDGEVFDPATDTFASHFQAMSHTRATHAMVDMGNGKAALAGGSNLDRRVDILDFSTETYTPLSAAQGYEGGFGVAAAAFDSGAVSIVGGDTAGMVLYLDAQGTIVRNTGSGLSRPRSFATATRITPTKILVVGGIDFTAGTLILRSADVVEEGGIGGSRTRETPISFLDPIAMHTATVLLDGRVLFCGGLNQNGGQPELSRGYLFTPLP